MTDKNEKNEAQEFLDEAYLLLVDNPNVKWVDQLTRMSEDEILFDIQKKLLILAELKIDQVLPENWLEMVHVKFITDKSVQKDAYKQLEKNDNPKETWFDMEQHSRNVIASIAAGMYLRTILKEYSLDNIHPDKEPSETRKDILTKVLTALKTYQSNEIKMSKKEE